MRTDMAATTSTDTKGDTWLRRSARALACGVLLAAAGLALVLGVADLAASNARVLLERIAAGTARPTIEQWDEAVDGLRLARHLVPWNADYRADLGRLYEWQGWQQLRRPEAARAYRRAAIVSYRSALARRPGWGYVWAQLAHVRLTLHGFDAEVEYAIERAAQLAPWEREAQRTLIWMGLSRWQALGQRSQSLVRDTVARAWQMGDLRPTIVLLAEQFRWERELATIRTPASRRGPDA